MILQVGFCKRDFARRLGLTARLIRRAAVKFRLPLPCRSSFCRSVREGQETSDSGLIGALPDRAPIPPYIGGCRKLTFKPARQKRSKAQRWYSRIRSNIELWAPIRPQTAVDEIEIQSRFEIEGVFWDPVSPDDRFPAHLSSDVKHLELTS